MVSDLKTLKREYKINIEEYKKLKYKNTMLEKQASKYLEEKYEKELKEMRYKSEIETQKSEIDNWRKNIKRKEEMIRKLLQKCSTSSSLFAKQNTNHNGINIEENKEE